MKKRIAQKIFKQRFIPRHKQYTLQQFINARKRIQKITIVSQKKLGEAFDKLNLVIRKKTIPGFHNLNNVLKDIDTITTDLFFESKKGSVKKKRRENPEFIYPNFQKQSKEMTGKSWNNTD